MNLLNLARKYSHVPSSMFFSASAVRIEMASGVPAELANKCYFATYLNRVVMSFKYGHEYLA